MRGHGGTAGLGTPEGHGRVRSDSQTDFPLRNPPKNRVVRAAGAGRGFLGQKISLLRGGSAEPRPAADLGSSAREIEGSSMGEARCSRVLVFKDFYIGFFFLCGEAASAKSPRAGSPGASCCIPARGSGSD